MCSTRLWGVGTELPKQTRRRLQKSQARKGPRRPSSRGPRHGGQGVSPVHRRLATPPPTTWNASFRTARGVPICVRVCMCVCVCMPGPGMVGPGQAGRDGRPSRGGPWVMRRNNDNTHTNTSHKQTMESCVAMLCWFLGASTCCPSWPIRGRVRGGWPRARPASPSLARQTQASSGMHSPVREKRRVRVAGTRHGKPRPAGSGGDGRKETSGAGLECKTN